jgi:hypothetical protein
VAGFPDGVPWSLVPSGPTLTLSAGPLEARVFESTGHIQLAGPDLAGAVLANVMILASYRPGSEGDADVGRSQSAGCRRP